MNYSIRTALLALAASILFPATSIAQEEVAASPLSVAVLNFGDGSNDLKGVGTSISALLQVQLTIHSDAILVERAELNEVLAEQELTLSDAVTPAQAAKVAQLTGAEVLISGRVFTVQNRVHLVAKVISSSTSRVFGATASYDNGKPLDGAVEKLATDVGKILKDKNADLRGGASLEEKTNAEVAALLKDKPAKKFYVNIPESIIQVIVPDPAAQTEIARTLEAAGWKSVATADEAEVIIRGEAFAETAIRRGNLWFTRARLEFTVTNAKGEVLKTDRIVCGNVDLAQAVGAKGALQKAGLMAAPEVVKAALNSKAEE
jgi:TolB-like protein